MFRNLAMLVLCLVVGSLLALILTWFLRRLTRIEEEKWGKKK